MRPTVAERWERLDAVPSDLDLSHDDYVRRGLPTEWLPAPRITRSHSENESAELLWPDVENRRWTW